MLAHVGFSFLKQYVLHQEKECAGDGLSRTPVEPPLPSPSSDLLQVSCHVIRAAVKNAAEKLHDLLIIQVVNTLNDTRQQQLHC